MLKSLLIVESPSKVKTISSYFKPSENIQVTATYGHLRSLPSKPKAIGFNESIDFQWVVNKPTILNNLIKMIETSQEIILATDCDREGEAISWHVIQVMNEKKIYNKIINRITFQEITPTSIRKALDNKRSININLVNGYLARLTEDYSCGFSITEKMWKKIPCGYSSAGRVQSPTLELIRSREEAINQFISKTFFSIDVWLQDDQNNKIDESPLTIVNNEKIGQDTIPTEEIAKEFMDKIKKLKDFQIIKSEIKKTKSRKNEPLKTSTLQKLANSRLNFDGKKTMQVAQSLYEGINIKDGNGQDKLTGLITYMRTDSTFLNEEFVDQTQQYIQHKYGKDYVDSQKLSAKKNKNAQEAHEAIRPTNIEYHPETIKNYLTKDQWSLYNLIWNITVGCLMSPAEYANLNVVLHNINEPNNLYEIKKTFKSLIFEGNLILDPKKIDDYNYNLDNLKNIFKINNIFVVDKCKFNQHKTMAPPRYNSGSLVEEMENQGIGRPSTFVTTIESLIKYKYFDDSSKEIKLNPKGAVVSLFLQNYFSRFLKIESTALMEENLDKIAHGEKNWEEEVRQFIKDLQNNCEEVTKIETNTVLTTLGSKLFNTFNITNQCPKCKSLSMVLATKMNLFFKCLQCNNNIPLDNLLNIHKDIDLGKFAIKNSIYGTYITNNETKKNISIPLFINPNTLSPEDLEWLNNLPLLIDENLYLKVGKYGFYLEKDEEKSPIKEKLLENIKITHNNIWKDYFEKNKKIFNKKIVKK